MVLLEQEELALLDPVKPYIHADERDQKSRYSVLFLFFK